jgi:hypothetical protein
MSPSVWVIIGNDNEAEVGPVNINQGGGICPKAQISNGFRRRYAQSTTDRPTDQNCAFSSRDDGHLD